MNKLKSIVVELVQKPKEEQWFEFKENKSLSNSDIGEYISALSNSACLAKQPFGYLIWGIKDDTHEIVGTSISLKTRKEGNVELEFWLNININPKIDFSIHEFEYEKDTKITLIKVAAAKLQPVSFKGIEFVRVDSNKTKLKLFLKKNEKYGTVLPIGQSKPLII